MSKSLKRTNNAFDVVYTGVYVGGQCKSGVT